MKGIAASEGVAVGRALLYALEEPEIDAGRTTASPDSELKRLDEALDRARASLKRVRDRAAEQVGEAEAALFDAQALMLDDPMLVGPVEEHVRGGMPAAVAIRATVDQIASQFAAMEDEYFRAREADVRDVGQRLLRALAGTTHESLASLTEPVVVVARDLTPSDTATLRREMVLGFATDAGGLTSHTAILARAMGIPAVVALGDATTHVRTGDVVLVDGTEGVLELNPSSDRVAAAGQATPRAAPPVVRSRVQTRDGVEMEVAANAGRLADVEAAMAQGADGIGLFRTEFLYLDRPDLPGEDEQFEVYRRSLELLDGRPLVIRTLDAGGDKALPGLPPADEPNPFLGLRGIRLCLQRPELVEPQLRAALRASSIGDVRLMFPMVAFLEELQAARALLERCRADLEADGVPLGTVQVGIMVETPAAALIAPRLAQEADFFSLGTNDLVQYTLAVDRTNQRVAHLYQSLHPSVLRAVAAVVQAAHARGRWVGVCGEMGGMPDAMPLLVGLGVDELSVSPPAVPRAKALVQGLSVVEAGRVASRALECGTTAEVEALALEMGT